MEKFHPERIPNIVKKVEKGLPPLDQAEINAALERMNTLLPSEQLPDPETKIFDAGDFKYEVTIRAIDHFDEDWAPGETYKKIQSFKILAADQTINIFDLLPPSCRIIYEETPLSQQNGYASYINNQIHMRGNVATMHFFLTLLHEVGHFVDGKETAETPANKLVSDHKFVLEANEVRSERDSTAFALSLFRSICTDLQMRKDAITTLKYAGLDGYHDAMRYKMERKNNPPQYGGDADDFSYLM